MKQDSDFKCQPPSYDSLRLESLKVVIVGGTNGLGRAIARLLASRGADVTVVGRTFRDSDVMNIEFIEADLSSIKVARETAERLPAEKIDVLLFTAGILSSRAKQVTEEGIERDLAVSFLNRVAMTQILAPKMKKKNNSLGFGPRIFVMGFPGVGILGSVDDLNQENGYSFIAAHKNTIAGNEAIVVAGAERYPELNFFGLNPGQVKTNIRDNLLGAGSWKSYIIEGIIGLLNKTADQYAQKIVPLLVSPEIDHSSGISYNAKGQAIPTSKGMTSTYANSFVEASENLLKEKRL